MKTKTGKWMLLLSASMVLFAIACKRDMQETELAYDRPNIPDAPYDYSVPGGIFNGTFGTVTNVDNNKATLGRVLFYDKHLSYTNTVSCGSCHLQTHAFADEVKFSKGFAGAEGTRNAPPIFNLTPNNNLFWDARATSLQDMVLMPVKHREEMGMEDIDAMVKKVKTIPYYEELFDKAFSSKKITTERISEAISQFLLAIRSTNSKYDNYTRGNGGLTTHELNGMNLFFNQLHCTKCHQDAQNTSGYQPHIFNIGLDSKYKDEGMEGVTHRDEDEGMFKAPQLRNLAYTAPYMHDGRFATLEEVVDHYNENVVNHKNLSHQLTDIQFGGGGWGKNNPSQPKFNKYGVPTLELTDDDKKDLVAFLKAMSDESLTTDKRFSDPFAR